MRILFVTSDVPHPLRGGGGMRAYHLLLHLARQGHELSVISVTSSKEKETLDALKEIWHTVDFVAENSSPPYAVPIHTGNRRIDGYLALLLEPTYKYAYEYRTVLQQRVLNALRTSQFDCILVEHQPVADALLPVLRSSSIPAIASFPDVLSAYYERRHRLASEEKGTWNWARHTIHRAKYRRSERAILRGYSMSLCVSSVDAQLLQRVARRPVMIIPNGVDAVYFSPNDTAIPEPDTLVYAGHMAYPPNIDAMTYFCKDILPLIWQQRPNVRLKIVGLHPAPEVLALDKGQGGRIEVVGAVPDTRPYLSSASIAIVPLRLGSGTRLKILEAFAMQRPVISTSIGAEGLDIVPDEHCMLADTAQSFAQTVLRLLNSPEEASRLATAGRALVVEKYQWPAIVAQLEHYLQQLADRNPNLSS